MMQFNKYLFGSLIFICSQGHTIGIHLLPGERLYPTSFQPSSVSPLLSGDQWLNVGTREPTSPRLTAIGENLVSPKRWLVENTLYGSVSTGESLALALTPDNPHSGLAQVITPDDQELSDTCISGEYEVPTGTIVQYGRTSAQQGTNLPASYSHRVIPTFSTISKTNAPRWKKKRWQKKRWQNSAEREATILEIIREAVYESPQLEQDEAAELFGFFRKLPRGETKTERRERMKLNSILIQAAYGPKAANSPEQLLDYVEYLEKVDTPTAALEVLHTELSYWKYTQQHGHGRIISDKALLWAIHAGARLLRRCCSDTLEQEWETIHKAGAIMGIDGVLGILKEHHPKLDAELYLRSLQLHNTPAGSHPDYHGELWSVFKAQISERWLGRDNLAKSDEFTLLQHEIAQFDPERDSERLVHQKLKFARQLAALDSKDMDFVYRLEHQFYKMQGYSEHNDPLNRRVRDFNRMFKERRYEEVIRGVVEFRDERGDRITLALRKKLDGMLLKSHADIFAATRNEEHRRKALHLLPGLMEIEPEGFLMMAYVYRSLDEFELAKQMAIRLFNRSLYNEPINNHNIFTALEVLAESTIPDDLQEAMELYYLLLGKERFSQIFPGFIPSEDCRKTEDDILSRAGGSGLTKPGSIAAATVHMFRNMSRYGHFREAITVAEFLRQPKSRLFIKNSGFFTTKEGSLNFYSSLVFHLILMNHALDQEGPMKRFLRAARATESSRPKTLEAMKYLRFSASALSEVQHLSHHDLFQVIAFKYYKLIYLARQIQLYPDETKPLQLELGQLFAEIWEANLNLLEQNAHFNNSLFMVKRLKQFYSWFAHIIDDSVTLTIDQQTEPDPQDSLHKPTFFSENHDFHYLETQVFSEAQAAGR